MRISLIKLDLKEQNLLLERIAIALERIAPPLPPPPPLRKADLSDLRRVDQRELSMLRGLEDEFARMTQTVPGSEAFLKARRAFEDEVRAAEGQEAVDQLFWNRIGRHR
jgi:hypothetical protein